MAITLDSHYVLRLRLHKLSLIRLYASSKIIYSTISFLIALVEAVRTDFLSPIALSSLSLFLFLYIHYSQRTRCFVHWLTRTASSANKMGRNLHWSTVYIWQDRRHGHCRQERGSAILGASFVLPAVAVAMIFSCSLYRILLAEHDVIDGRTRHIGWRSLVLVRSSPCERGVFFYRRMRAYRVMPILVVHHFVFLTLSFRYPILRYLPVHLLNLLARSEIRSTWCSVAFCWHSQRYDHRSVSLQYSINNKDRKMIAELTTSSETHSQSLNRTYPFRSLNRSVSRARNCILWGQHAIR